MKIQSMFKYVFGPVPSRRLGKSLGIDIIPYKTCTYNCIYCQIGDTTDLTITRKDFYQPNCIINEIREKLNNGPRPDYITFSGSGEPTLNSTIGDIIRTIKDFTSIPVVVLTNGSLLFMKEVREDIKEADIVIPSLDATNPDLFSKINMPHKDLDLDVVIKGIATFRKEFCNKLWLEVFIIKDMTDSLDYLRSLVPIIKYIQPDLVHLNTAVRPTSVHMDMRVDDKKMEEIARFLEQETNIVSEFKLKRGNYKKQIVGIKSLDDMILNLLRRRPCTLEDIGIGLGVDISVARECIRNLLQKGWIKKEEEFFVLNKSEDVGNNK